MVALVAIGNHILVETSGQEYFLLLFLCIYFAKNKALNSIAMDHEPGVIQKVLNVKNPIFQTF
jgi:hypothetical protein